MTSEKEVLFCFALAIHLYDRADSGISVVFFTDTCILLLLVNVCMIAVNIFNRKCLNHVERLIITGSLFLFLLARNTFLFCFLFLFSSSSWLSVHEKRLCIMFIAGCHDAEF